MQLAELFCIDYLHHSYFAYFIQCNSKPFPSSTWNHTDGGKNIGGYSITSIPQELPQIELAVQSSRHPVAKWATAHAQPNDSVDIRVGGSFTYKSDYDSSSKNTGSTNRLLFIAGGVGINPLFSMIQQWNVDQRKQNNINSRAVLLYSGRAVEDLLFVGQLDKLISNQFRVILCKTSHQQKIVDKANRSSIKSNGKVSGDNCIVREGRIDVAKIKDAVSWLNKSDNKSIASNEKMMSSHTGKQDKNMIADAIFVCGPPGMPESMVKILSEERLVQSTNNVHFEKWW